MGNCDLAPSGVRECHIESCRFRCAAASNFGKSNGKVRSVPQLGKEGAFRSSLRTFHERWAPPGLPLMSVTGMSWVQAQMASAFPEVLSASALKCGVCQETQASPLTAANSMPFG